MVNGGGHISLAAWLSSDRGSQGGVGGVEGDVWGGADRDTDHR